MWCSVTQATLQDVDRLLKKDYFTNVGFTFLTLTATLTDGEARLVCEQV
jgi:hypothetical protein